MSEPRPRDETIALEDLVELGANDLRAVFQDVGPECVVLALSDAEPGLRRRLLTRWRPRGPRPGEAHPEASPDRVRSAQLALTEAVCRLSRCGQIAFDHPDDILDQVA